MRKLTQQEITESRIRDIKRKLLHQKDESTRQIWMEHITYLESQI